MRCPWYKIIRLWWRRSLADRNNVQVQPCLVPLSLLMYYEQKLVGGPQGTSEFTLTAQFINPLVSVSPACDLGGRPLEPLHDSNHLAYGGFINQDTTPTNVVRRFILSNVAEVPKCFLVIYWLNKRFVLLYVQCV